MFRFEDGATILSGGSYSNDDNGGNTKPKPQKDNLVVGKKRIPSTPHPAGLERAKKRSPGNDDGNNDHQIDANTRMCIASQDIDSVRNRHAIEILVPIVTVCRCWYRSLQFSEL